MKRLKKILLEMDLNTTTYEGMYNGIMRIVNCHPPIIDYSPIYYEQDIGFEITPTHKLAKDKPTITVIIPARKLFSEKKEGIYVKRLKSYLLNMENDTKSYKEMYEGREIAINLPSGYRDIIGTEYSERDNTIRLNGERIQLSRMDYDIRYDNTYFVERDLSFTIEESDKLSKDKPTITYNIPASHFGISCYTDAAADFCLRALRPYIDSLNEELYNRSRPDNENGKYYIPALGGEIVKRNSAYFAMCPQKDYENGGGDVIYLLNDGIVRPPIMCLCIKMQVQLPKRKLKKAIQMLCRDLPDTINSFISQLDAAALDEALALAEKQNQIREYLKSSDYCAFIANGSILPRAKGGDLPMKNAIPFMSPPNDEIEICGVRGMGIKRGVTFITGGGYSGKSTLLDAISAGVYNHILGDGRELCISDDSAFTVSAEDTRSIKSVNISPFIKWLPNGDTCDFSTERASGSTSQAANIMEAVDFGARLLLIDEDKSATNFMIRDKMMKELIEKEPITPFTDRVNELYTTLGASTILVIGGSGEYLGVADRIYMMDEFQISDATERSKQICQSHGYIRQSPPRASWTQEGRVLYSQGFTSYPEGSGSERLIVSDLGIISIGDEKIDVRSLHNLASSRQLDALGFMLRYLEVSNKELKIDIRKRIDELYEKIEINGLELVYSSYFTTCERFLDLPRKIELMAVINRMRRVLFSKEKM